MLRHHHPKDDFQASSSSLLVIVPFRGNRENNDLHLAGQAESFVFAVLGEAFAVVTGGVQGPEQRKAARPVAAVTSHTGNIQQ